MDVARLPWMLIKDGDEDEDDGDGKGHGVGDCQQESMFIEVRRPC